MDIGDYRIPSVMDIGEVNIDIENSQNIARIISHCLIFSCKKVQEAAGQLHPGPEGLLWSSHL